MKKILYKLFITTTLLLVLVGCDQYELVNTDEYLLVKKDETKEYVREIRWSGLNILSTVRLKYIEGKLHYRIEVEDLDKVLIKETDYYKSLINGSQVLVFSDVDNFTLHEIEVPFRKFKNIMNDDGSSSSIEGQGSEEFDEIKFSKIHTVRLGTNGIR